MSESIGEVGNTQELLDKGLGDQRNTLQLERTSKSERTHLNTWLKGVGASVLYGVEITLSTNISCKN